MTEPHSTEDDVMAVARAIHDVDCEEGPACEEVMTAQGRYGRYAAAAIGEVKRLRTADGRRRFVDYGPGGERS